MELRDYLLVLRRRWVIISVVLLACLAGAAGATLSAAKTYKASSQLLVALSDIGSGLDDGTGAYYIPQRVQAFAPVLATPPLVDAAVQEAGLPAGTAVSVAATAATGSAVITIDVVASSPSVAQAVANAYVKVLPEVLADLNQVASPNELTFQTLSEAQLPTSAFAPDPYFNGGIGLAAGLILGLGAAVTREAFDRRIRDSRAVKNDLGQPLLGVVPKELRRVLLPAVSHPDSLRAEAYRTIRTNLQFAGADGLVRSLAITSPSAGEGKSALAGNLAVLCARAGQRVVLVDADLRRPTLHHQFRAPASVGLSSVLDGSALLDDALQDIGSQITLLASGPVTRNPSELLAKPMLGQIIEKLEGAYDIVIVDTAPMLPVADGVLVSARCQGAVILGRLRATTLSSLRRALDTLTRSRATVLGVVLIGADEDPDTAYGYSYTAPDRRGRGDPQRRKAASGPSHSVAKGGRRPADDGR